MDEIHRINAEIDSFDLSEAAERLEAMVEEADVEKGDIGVTSGHQGGADGIRSLERSIYRAASEFSVLRLYDRSPLPLHPASIKQESGHTADP